MTDINPYLLRTDFENYNLLPNQIKILIGQHNNVMIFLENIMEYSPSLKNISSAYMEYADFYNNEIIKLANQIKIFNSYEKVWKLKFDYNICDIIQNLQEGVEHSMTNAWRACNLPENQLVADACGKSMKYKLLKTDEEWREEYPEAAEEYKVDCDNIVPDLEEITVMYI